MNLQSKKTFNDKMKWMAHRNGKNVSFSADCFPSNTDIITSAFVNIDAARFLYTHT